MKILLVHCHYRLPGGEDAVFAAERALLERRGHTVLVYERSNEEAAHGPAKALLPLRAVWNRSAAREVADTASIFSGRLVDGYSNYMTVRLFTASTREDAYVREALENGVTARE